MLSPPVPIEEEERLKALYRLELLDTPPDERFDEITQFAREEFQVAVSMITLIDRDRQWFKSVSGFDISETPRAISFCAHTILKEGCLFVNDTSIDPRFAANPFVADEPNVRFYAGSPIHDPTLFRIGAICLIDLKPRLFDATDIAKLTELANIVEKQIAVDAPNLRPN